MASQSGKFFTDNHSTEAHNQSGANSMFLKSFRSSPRIPLKFNHSTEPTLLKHSDIFTTATSSQPFLKDIRSKEAYLSMTTGKLPCSKFK